MVARDKSGLQSADEANATLNASFELKATLHTCRRLFLAVVVRARHGSSGAVRAATDKLDVTEAALDVMLSVKRTPASSCTATYGIADVAIVARTCRACVVAPCTADVAWIASVPTQFNCGKTLPSTYARYTELPALTPEVDGAVGQNTLQREYRRHSV
ncbi:hypothetical protein H310_07884 [Aphanomyces invadans]|uniref:Uncharacterized protein n=1 Tax=Aphanomyces invadans TaxID=157072 RepID=A0A024U0V3_9STRA|nr:hypothetical protein H310_07884 [Aphanomyces invadans]ETV99844.1 hypothetical protein H310_07884 [Aphanomyces invadans]|eukprot:XP_008871620.1 hypothetical protein H310_07884 [Aphanomyces invadans]